MSDAGKCIFIIKTNKVQGARYRVQGSFEF
jgi:hypothetical protein